MLSKVVVLNYNKFVATFFPLQNSTYFLIKNYWIIRIELSNSCDNIRNIYFPSQFFN